MCVCARARVCERVSARALSASDLGDCIVGTARRDRMTLTHRGHRRSDGEVANGRPQESADRTRQHGFDLRVQGGGNGRVERQQ